MSSTSCPVKQCLYLYSIIRTENIATGHILHCSTIIVKKLHKLGTRKTMPCSIKLQKQHRGRGNSPSYFILQWILIQKMTKRKEQFLT